MNHHSDPADDSPITWTEFFQDYERTAFPTLAMKTRKDSRQAAAAIDRLLGPTPLDELPDRLDELDLRLRQEGSGPDTVRQRMSRLGAMLEWGRRERLLESAPKLTQVPPAIAAGDQAGAEWRDFRRRYEREVLATLAPATRAEARGTLNELERLVGPASPADLTASAISAYSALLQNPAVSVFTVRHKLFRIRAILRWGARMKVIDEAPFIQMPRRAKGQNAMKGRPLTDDEFAAMLAATPSVVGGQRAPSWRFYLRALWSSGLRLTESLHLRWNGDAGLIVDFSRRWPLLRIPAELEKGHQDRLLPMAPEFAELLLATPAEQRTGFVFNLRMQRVVHRRPTFWRVGRIVSEIGEAAGVRVSSRNRKQKYASAHDLRRSFGERWADRVMPKVLMELMRHESIETTMRFYVGRNAERTAEVLWEAHAAAGANKPAGGAR